MIRQMGSSSPWASPQSDGFQSSPFSSLASPPLQSMLTLTLGSPLSPSCSSHNYRWVNELREQLEEPGLRLVHLLQGCATHVSDGSTDRANACLHQLSDLVSLTGGPMERVAAYFAKALAARITKSWPGVYRALSAAGIPAAAAERQSSARRLFFELCPYLRVAFAVVNQAIIEAMESEKVVHVIDLDGSHPDQWVPLLHALCARPGGPPYLKITAINEQKQVLDRTRQRLAEEADALQLPFQFNPVVCKLQNIESEMLGVKTGEAVAVSSVLQLHTLLVEARPDAATPDGQWLQTRSLAELLNMAELIDREKNGSPAQLLLSPSQIEAAINNRRANAAAAAAAPPQIDRFLQVLRSLLPKMMVVVEQDSNHNGGLLVDRFGEALHFYSAVFDSLDSTLPRECPQRVALEKHLLGRQIENIVACEGAERVERHEKIDQWMKRLDRAGFAFLPLSYGSVSTAKRVLHSYSCEAYRVVEDWACLALCWQDRCLFSVSTWQS